MTTTGVSALVDLVLASGQSLQRLLEDIGLSFTQPGMGVFVAAIGRPFIVHGVIALFRTRSVPLLPS